MTPHRRPVIAIAVVTLVDCVIAAAWCVSARGGGGAVGQLGAVGLGLGLVILLVGASLSGRSRVARPLRVEE